jgi:hypothetical protein
VELWTEGSACGLRPKAASRQLGANCPQALPVPKGCPQIHRRCQAISSKPTVWRSRRATLVKLLARRVKYLAKGGKDEGLLGFDPISPLKPHLGADFDALTCRLRQAIAVRYDLPEWPAEDYLLHKRADRLAAASEALHVAGWSREDIRETLDIRLTPVMTDPLPLLPGFQPWKPWPPRRAAALFLIKLRELDRATDIDAPADLTAAIDREATLADLGAAFSRLPPSTRRRLAHPLTGNSLTDTFVYVETDDISQQHLEGVIVDGERDDEGQWLLDGQFTVFTTDQELIRVSGWGCHVEIQ